MKRSMIVGVLAVLLTCSGRLPAAVLSYEDFESLNIGSLSGQGNWHSIFGISSLAVTDAGPIAGVHSLAWGGDYAGVATPGCMIFDPQTSSGPLYVSALVRWSGGSLADFVILGVCEGENKDKIEARLEVDKYHSYVTGYAYSAGSLAHGPIAAGTLYLAVMRLQENAADSTKLDLSVKYFDVSSGFLGAEDFAGGWTVSLDRSKLINTAGTGFYTQIDEVFIALNNGSMTVDHFMVSDSWADVQSSIDGPPPPPQIDYYVATNGDDSNPGTLAEPFATIQKAAFLIQPGRTVYIRGGTYREQVCLMRSGEPNAPITFTAYNGENVMVTATDQLTGWTQHDGSIYKAPFSADGFTRRDMTVFVNGRWIHEAGWTDKGIAIDLLERDTFATYESGTRTTITDSDLVGFSDDYWNGALIWVQSHNWAIEQHQITDFDGTTGTVTFDGSLTYDPQANFEYLIYGTYKALDAPDEWYYDGDAGMLYLWVDGGGDPDNELIEVKSRWECFDLNGHHSIHIRSIDMRGGDLDMAGSSGVLLQGAHIQMPDRRFGSGGQARSLTVSGHDNVIRDNEFDGVWGAAVSLYGADNSIVNNYFHDIGYSNTGGAGVTMGNCKEGNLISHNTFTRIGRGAIAGSGNRFVLQYNDFSQSSLLTEDNGVIAFGNQSYANSMIHHNVFHHIDGYIASGLYVDCMGSDLVVHHNLSYDIPFLGMQYNLPNAFMLIYNNTCYNKGTITAWSPTVDKDATGTRLVNNICSSIDGDLVTGGAVIANNFVTSSRSHFVDAAGGDFRLKSASGAVDTGAEIAGITDGFSGIAPDCGALELGQPMWEYGHDFANPPNPVYDWQPVAFMNQIINPGFEVTLAPWTVASGTPVRVNANAWNYRQDGLGVKGTGAVELQAGDAVRQVFSGLVPNTHYEFYAWGRQMVDIQIEDYDTKSGDFTSGSYRSETWLGDLDAGEWLCYQGFDFGSDQPRYDRVEIGQQWDTLIDVQVRLDSPTGQVVSTVSLPGGDNHWSVARADLVPVTGVHDVYLVFMGTADATAMIDRLRFLDTATEERMILTVRGYDGPASEASQTFGGAYWNNDPPKVVFETGATVGDVTFTISKASGYLNGYIDQAVVVEAVSLPEAPTNLRAGQVGIGRVQLDWDDHASNELGFVIQRQTGPGGVWEDIAQNGANITRYINTGLIASQEYGYRVCAMNEAGRSAYSNVVHVDTSFDLSAFAWLAQCWKDLNPLDGMIAYDGFAYPPGESLNAQADWSNFVTLGGDEVVITEDWATENTLANEEYRMYVKSLESPLDVNGDIYYFSAKITPLAEAISGGQLFLFGWANSANQIGQKLEIRYSNFGSGTITVTGNGQYQYTGGVDAMAGHTYLLVAKSTPVNGFEDRVLIDVTLIDVTDGHLDDEEDYIFLETGLLFQTDLLASQFSNLLWGFRSNVIVADDLLLATSWQGIQQAVNWNCQSVDLEPDGYVYLEDLGRFVLKWLE